MVLSLGRVGKEKNIGELIQYLHRINDPKIIFLIVGDGPYMPHLQSLTQQLGFTKQVIFAGRVPHEETVDYYRLADVFVSASRSETQGLTYIEALAAGAPALCRRDRSLEGVIIDGDNGWQYDGYEDFAGYLQLILQHKNLQQRLSNGAAEWAAKRFSATAFAKSIYSVYEEAAERLNSESAG